MLLPSSINNHTHPISDSVRGLTSERAIERSIGWAPVAALVADAATGVYDDTHPILDSVRGFASELPIERSIGWAPVAALVADAATGVYDITVHESVINDARSSVPKDSLYNREAIICQEQ